MSIAYVVIAHRAPGQAARMIRRLAEGDEGTAFFIHVDRKAPQAVHRTLRKELEAVPRCEFLRPQTVRWAHWSQVQVALRGLQAVEESGFDPDQTVLSSGQHYPIKPAAQIAERLSDPNVSFMQRVHLPHPEWWPAQRGGLDRFERVYVRLPRRGMRPLPFLRRRLPSRYEPWGGAGWWSLGREHRRHVLEVAGRDRRLIRTFRHAGASDEVFFQTVLMSSPFRDAVIDDSLVFAIWGEMANNPETLTRDDLDALTRSSKLFARKFDTEVDPTVLDLIDERLLGR
jgi:core-2/I-Branching enzyme